MYDLEIFGPLNNEIKVTKKKISDLNPIGHGVHLTLS